ncbi:YcxB family protein [Streptomyces sp. NK15101]|uniref:YcxB family protein n=1 Tax=Streptomyces sp. NK15101 TaxID=2873261 RepID=UPI001CED1372|nr:YcxB family protein [Streptomyces sp. NK15101]
MVMSSGSQDATRGTVGLVFRPTRADLLTAVLVRERLRRLHILRWAFVLLFGGFAVLAAIAQATVTVSTGLFLLLAGLIWAMPHFQANHALRTVEWQGEYRASVSETGIEMETAHVSLLQRWSVFRGYRETRDHLVLLSRDPNILLAEVLPLRGLRSPEEADRLRVLVDGHLPRL